MRTIRHADPNDVLAFVEVAVQRNFGRAARSLGVSKSTVSERVAALEETLGARLLTRTTRSVALTDVGARYLHEVRPAISALRAAESVVTASRREPHGTLRLTAAIEFGQRFLKDVLIEYGRRYPSVVVDVDLTDRHVNLVEEGFDIAVRIGSLEDSGLIARRLAMSQSVRVFASPAYLERAGKPKSPRDLAKHRCLVMRSAQTAASWTFRGGLVVRVDPQMAVNSFQLLTELTAAGLGIARLPNLYAEPFVANRRIVEVLARHAPASFPLSVVLPSNRLVSPAVRAMSDLLVETFQQS